MADVKLPAAREFSFEALKKVNAHGAEYWSARDLPPLLGYEEWRKFEDAVRRAVTSCKLSGNPPRYHFGGTDKMIALAKGAERRVTTISPASPAT